MPVTVTAHGIPADAFVHAADLFRLALAEGDAPLFAVASVANDVARVHRIEPHDVARVLRARFLSEVVVVAAAPPPEREPLDVEATFREASDLALDALHLAADVAEAGEDDAAHTRALRAMRHLLAARRAFAGEGR
jgi:hypothetical protein